METDISSLQIPTPQPGGDRGDTDIEAGIADADAGRVVDVTEVRAEYGLPS